MDIETTRDGATLIVKANARIDSSNASEFQSALETVIGSEDRTVILDMENLSYISSAGLRVILIVAKTLGQRDAELAVCSLQDPIRNVFEISGFDKIIPTHASQSEAIAALGGG